MLEKSKPGLEWTKLGENWIAKQIKSLLQSRKYGNLIWKTEQGFINQKWTGEVRGQHNCH